VEGGLTTADDHTSELGCPPCHWRGVAPVN